VGFRKFTHRMSAQHHSAFRCPNCNTLSMYCQWVVLIFLYLI
jgi:hypothetical protein